MNDTRPAFLDPGGYATHAGGLVGDGARRRMLTAVFLRSLWRGWRSRLFAASLLLAPLVIAIVAMLRLAFNGAALPAAERLDFLLDCMGWLWKANVLLVVMGSAGQIAPLLIHDAADGALLLYFSRPLEPRHYLWARLMACAGTVFAWLAAPALVQWAVLVSLFDGPAASPTGQAGVAVGALFPLVLLLTSLVASAVVSVVLALVALATGTVARSAGAAPIWLGGGVLGSVVAASFATALAGSDSLWGGIQLLRGLLAFVDLPHAALYSVARPSAELAQSAMGAMLWLLMAVGAWSRLQAFLRAPVLGKGRVG
jgi:hypothetical protein